MHTPSERVRVGCDKVTLEFVIIIDDSVVMTGIKTLCDANRWRNVFVSHMEIA